MIGYLELATFGLILLLGTHAERWRLLGAGMLAVSVVALIVHLVRLLRSRTHGGNGE